MTILLWVALLPPIILLFMVYKQDTIEKEPLSLIIRTFIFGALSIIPAMIIELVLQYTLLDSLGYNAANSTSIPLILLDNVLCVGLVEELCKYVAAKTIWKNPAFNYRFDAIIYAVSSALGFAALENILYVFQSGLSTGLMRAVLSIPLHCICGIFMGVYMGQAKLCECRDDKAGKRAFLRRAIFIPMLIHGIYDSLASMESGLALLLFLIFVVITDIISIKRIKAESKSDEPLYPFTYYGTDDYWHTQTPGPRDM